MLWSAVNGHRISKFTHLLFCRTALRLHIFLNNLRISEAFKCIIFYFSQMQGSKTVLIFESSCSTSFVWKPELSQVFLLRHDRLIGFTPLLTFNRSCTVHCRLSTIAGSVTFTQCLSRCCCADTGPMKDDDFCTAQERRCRAPGRAPRRSIQLWVSCFSKEGALSHRVRQNVYTSPPYSFAKHFAFVPSSQRDAQVTRREPEKAFRHQPATQTAEVPGGRRGHQGGPKVLPLGRGHQ